MAIRTLLSTAFLFMIIWSAPTAAQIIDDTALEDLQQNGVTFLEGVFVAYLADTVSIQFIQHTFQDQGIGIVDIDIQPLVIQLIGSPSQETLQALRDHPLMRVFQPTPFIPDSNKIETYSSATPLTKQELEAIRNAGSSLKNTVFIEFDYSVNKKQLRSLLSAYDDLAYKIFRDHPRTITLKAEAGNEFPLMDKVEQLPFVEFTTMLGKIDY